MYELNYFLPSLCKRLSSSAISPINSSSCFSRREECFRYREDTLPDDEDPHLLVELAALTIGLY